MFVSIYPTAEEGLTLRESRATREVTRYVDTSAFYGDLCARCESLYDMRRCRRTFFRCFPCQIEVAADERATQFGDKLFGGLTGITQILRPKSRHRALRALCPVRESIGEGGVVALGIAKGFEGRHLDSVDGLRVIVTIAAMPKGGVYFQYILTIDVSSVTLSTCRK